MSTMDNRSVKPATMVNSGVLMLFWILFASLVSGFSSALAWPAPSHDLDTMSQLLVSRVGSESTFVKAKQIIQQLSSSSTCSYAPTVRLLQQCKNIKPRHENPHSEHQINNAESVYAISMALCEAQQAQIMSPSACRIFEQLLERSVTESIEIVRPEEIGACSAVLYDTPTWTSYSTFKSNSKFLCDTSRTDYRQEELLQTLQDVTGVIPEILQVLSDHRFEAQSAMSQLRETALDVDIAQREILQRAQEQEQVHATHVTQLMQHMETLQRTMADAVGENSKILDLSTVKASDVQGKLIELYGSFAEAASGLTFDFEQQIVGLSRQVSSVITQIHDLGTQKELDQIREAINAATKASSDLSLVQAAQIATSQEVLQAFTDFSPEQLLPKWFSQISVSIASLTSTVRDESAFLAIFAAPSIGLSMCGRLRWASSLLLLYVFVRSAWSYVPPDPTACLIEIISRLPPSSIHEALYFSAFAAPAASFATLGSNKGAFCTLSAYISCRSVWDILGTHKHAVAALFSYLDARSAGVYIIGALTASLCICVALLAVDYLLCRQCAVLEPEPMKAPKRAIKASFERSRRACSVPLDLDCA